MNALTKMTAQQAYALTSFLSSSTPGQTNYLDASDKSHLTFIQTMLEAAGRLNAGYPHLYNALDKPVAYKGAPGLDRAYLVDAGKTASGKATATIWSRSSGDTMIKGDHVMVFDSDNGQLLAQGENSAVRSGFVVCPTRSAIASPAGKKISILHLGHVTDADGSTRFFSYANSAVVTGNGITVNVTDPRLRNTTPPLHNYIEIAVGRVQGGSPANCDYIYVEPQNEINPFLIVPFTGDVPLSGAIDIGSLTIGDLDTHIIVKNAGGGTQEVTRATQYTTDAKLLGAFTVGSAPNILKFSLPFDGASYKATKSIVYNVTSLALEVQSYFYFAFNGIPLQGGNTAPPFYVCSIDTPDEPSINCTKIPNLYFWWHCLAKGTLVTLEDGSQKPIEDINETFRVKTGTNGKSFAVRATVLGQHSSNGVDAGVKIYRLTTANGKTITATENHMVFTASDKCRSIADLVAGDNVITEDGISAVKSNESISHDGIFYALALGNSEEQTSKDFPTNMASYYGGGILCGDQEAMRHNTLAMYDDLDYMLPRIKPELHQDYKSALTERRS